jgi:hypothetical protein
LFREGQEGNLYMFSTNAMFFPNIFDPQLIESAGAEPVDMTDDYLSIIPLLSPAVSLSPEGGCDSRQASAECEPVCYVELALQGFSHSPGPAGSPSAPS